MALTGECVYSSFPYLELKVGLGPSPHPRAPFPQGLPEERAGKKQQARFSTNSKYDTSATKANAASNRGKEGSILLWVVQTPSGLLDVVLLSHIHGLQRVENCAREAAWREWGGRYKQEERRKSIALRNHGQTARQMWLSQLHAGGFQ